MRALAVFLLTSIAYAAVPPPSPIVITRGGVYSGTWTSLDVNTAPVTITTNEPVTLRNFTVTGKSNQVLNENTSNMACISITGTDAGANVTIENGTINALDPGLGYERCRGIQATAVASLTVRHVTMNGTSFGLVLGASTVTQFTFENNLVLGTEDRLSDGNGGFGARGNGAHILYVNTVTLPNGADIGWNAIINAPIPVPYSIQCKGTGTVPLPCTSSEDLMDFYEAACASDHVCNVHDNYLQTVLTPSDTNNTAGGVTLDGPIGTTSFWMIQNNQCTHTGNICFALAAGHDNTYQNNRGVTCGKDTLDGPTYESGGPDGKSGVNAYIWNQGNPSGFVNNHMNGFTGGFVAFDPTTGVARPQNDQTTSVSIPDNDTYGPNNWENPCLVNGVLTLQPELDEMTTWTKKLEAQFR